MVLVVIKSNFGACQLKPIGEPAHYIEVLQILASCTISIFYLVSVAEQAVMQLPKIGLFAMIPIL